MLTLIGKRASLTDVHSERFQFSLVCAGRTAVNVRPVPSDEISNNRLGLSVIDPHNLEIYCGTTYVH